MWLLDAHEHVGPFVFYSASAWPIYSLMVKKYNIYPERADEPYTALTDMSVHHVMTSTAVKNMLSSLLTIYITARHISKLPHLVKVKLYRHTCWEESEHEQLHWWRCLKPWLTAQGQGFASQQRWALKALGQHCAFSMEPSFVVCIYCPGLQLVFFSYCVFTFLTLALVEEVYCDFVLMHLLIMSSNSNWHSPCRADPLLNTQM